MARWAELVGCADDSDDEQGGKAEEAPAKTIYDDSLKCTMCMELCNRPITVRRALALRCSKRCH